MRKREVDVESYGQHIVRELLSDAANKLVAGEHTAVLGAGDGRHSLHSPDRQVDPNAHNREVAGR